MRLVGSAVVAAAVVITSTAWAHHSPAAFDTDSQITIQGTVSRFDWTNPHVYIYVTTAAGAGESTEWLIETDGTSLLTRSGWSRESVRVGSVVTVRASPDRDTQRNHALLVSMVLSDGVVLTPRSAAAAGVRRATSLAGVWNGLRGSRQRRFGAFTPTPKGLAAVKAYTVAANPTRGCVPYAAPFVSSLPYLNEIEILDDRIMIRSEFFNVDRTVYMDGRGHPTDGARTNQGHSIGRWESDVLVVDTRLFADHTLGNYPGGSNELPSGPQKHLVERYQLSEDGTRLMIGVVLEDPEYLAEPFAMSIEWDYAPTLRLLRFGCEPEQARRYLMR
jgi:hypothetical protein